MNDFLEYHNWFDEAFEEKSDRRYVTFRIALNLLSQQKGHNIVETGTTRQVDDYGAGYSTYIFANFVEMYGGKITTIDIDPKNMEVCKEITKEFADKINYVVSDSLFALTKIEEPIDLLYLDSLDTPIPDNEDARLAQEHNLKEFKLVEHLLHKDSIVLIDDNDFVNGGKARLTKKYLAEKGWRLLINFQQSLWIK